jgi:hypothetical protein
MEEFKRTTPEMSPFIDKMLSFLGIQTMAAYNEPAQASPFAQLLSSIAPGLGTYLGSQAKTSPTSAPNYSNNDSYASLMNQPSH